MPACTADGGGQYSLRPPAVGGVKIAATRMYVRLLLDEPRIEHEAELPGLLV